MKTRYFLVEQFGDGTLKAHAVSENSSLFWARNKARATSALSGALVHICSVRESLDVHAEMSALNKREPKP